MSQTELDNGKPKYERPDFSKNANQAATAPAYFSSSALSVLSRSSS